MSDLMACHAFNCAIINGAATALEHDYGAGIELATELSASESDKDSGPADTQPTARRTNHRSRGDDHKQQCRYRVVEGGPVSYCEAGCAGRGRSREQ